MALAGTIYPLWMVAVVLSTGLLAIHNAIGSCHSRALQPNETGFGVTVMAVIPCSAADARG